MAFSSNLYQSLKRALRDKPMADSFLSDVETVQTTLAALGVTVAADVPSVGAGTVSTDSTITVEERGSSALRQTKITLASTPVTITEAATAGWGTELLYTFPSGKIMVLGVTAVFSVDWSGDENIGATGSGDISVGTTATDDATLDSTDVDLLPSTALDDPMVFGVGVAAGTLAASADFDGTTAAKTANLNMAVDAGDVSDDAVALVSGTVTITWTNLGDY